LEAATEQKDSTAAQPARDELNALLLFRSDMAAYLRLYTYLSQIFDYGSTDVEKRAIFYRRLLPLLEFGREREGIDLSKVMLTHHTLKSHGPQSMSLPAEAYPPLTPSTETGTAQVREKERVYLSEIIAKVNELLNDVLKGKLLESETLIQQAANNSKEQFANSPDLKNELVKAIIDALDAHTAMSTQALGSESVRKGLQDVLLNHAQLYESHRERAA
jgi:type I restriction enzyme R subunit